MSSNLSDRPILRRFFTTTHLPDSAGSTTNTTTTTASSFHGCSSIITHVESRWIVVDETPGGASDGPEIKEGNSQIEEIGAEDNPATDDDNSIHRTYQFENCHVYINSFNAHGVEVKNSGNYAPRVTHHVGTAPNEGLPSSSKLSLPELSIHLSKRPEGPQSQAPAFGQSYNRHQEFPPDSTFGSPLSLLFQLRDDSLSYASDDSHSIPPVGIDVPFPTFEQKQPTERDKLPATVELMQSNPASTTLPGPESQPHPFLPMHSMGLHPNFLSHILQPFPDNSPNDNTANNWNGLPLSTNLHPHHHPATPNSSRHHRPDTNSKSLEHHLDSALEILIQTSGVLADGVTPQARNTLKAINALVSMETPIYDPPTPRFKYVRKVAKWWQIPRSPK